MFRSGLMCSSITAAMVTGITAMFGCQSHPNAAVNPPAFTSTQPLDEQYASTGVVLPASSRVEAQAEPAVTSADIISWSRRGWTDEQIIDRLDRSGISFHLNTSDELTLRDAGVSDEVVRAMKASAWR